MKRIGLFVDGSNMFESARALNFKVDYSKLLKFYQQQGDVVHCMYFTALPPKTVDLPLRRTIDYLDYNGYNIIQKDTYEYVSAEGTSKRKGNMDVELAVYAMEVMHSLTHMVLFSGDGDFRILIEAAQRKGLHCTVVAALSLVADSMRRQPNEFIDLATLRDQFNHEQQPLKRKFLGSK
jgi:uncharacterized LabA/DUF88 family protein